MPLGEAFNASNTAMLLFHAVLSIFTLLLLYQTRDLEGKFTGLIRIRAPVEYAKFRWAFFSFIVGNLLYIIHYLDLVAFNLTHIIAQIFFFLAIVLMYLGIKTR